MITTSFRLAWAGRQRRITRNESTAQNRFSIRTLNMQVVIFMLHTLNRSGNGRWRTTLRGIGLRPRHPRASVRDAKGEFSWNGQVPAQALRAINAKPNTASESIAAEEPRFDG